MTSDSEFRETVNQLLEFLTPKQLAKDLGVTQKVVKSWADGRDLPLNGERENIYKLLLQNQAWDDWF